MPIFMGPMAFRITTAGPLRKRERRRGGAHHTVGPPTCWRPSERGRPHCIAGGKSPTLSESHQAREGEEDE